MAQKRERQLKMGPSVMSDETPCCVHKTNNTRAASEDFSKNTGKLYALSTLLQVSAYNCGALERLANFTEDNVVRLPGLALGCAWKPPLVQCSSSNVLRRKPVVWIKLEIWD